MVLPFSADEFPEYTQETTPLLDNARRTEASPV